MSEPSPYAIDFTPAARRGLARLPLPAATALHEHLTGPVAGSVWSHLKRSLANLAKRDTAQLTALVKTRLRRMQYQPGLIEGCLAGTRLDLTPFCKTPFCKFRT